MGQNFLVDRNVRDGIVRAAGIQADEVVLEVGPGLGVLTEALIETGARVTAVEKDNRLCEYLQKRFGPSTSFRLLAADALSLDADQLLDSGGGLGRVAKMVSNLPYSVGNRVLVDIVRSRLRPQVIVVTVQQEVAERLAAKPGGHDYGKLSLWVQLDYAVEKVKTVTRTCFWPPPDVQSAVVRMTRCDRSDVADEARTAFYALTETAFAQRRKQIGPVLTRGRAAGDRNVAEGLAAAGIDPKARPEDIQLDRWLVLSRWCAGQGEIRGSTPG
jgi:16S rRNA (adenine1518-N6/adenine1519-N6)-dimethyltransferase